jgi:hypothetical protein
MLFTGLAAMIAVAPATPDASQTELAQLQTKAMAFVSTVATQTEIGQVQAALNTNEGSVDQPCGRMCSRNFEVAGGKTVPFGATLLQYTSRLNANNYHYDRPFEAEEVLFELDIAATAPADACFSETLWNTALTQAGWEPLKPYDTTVKIRVTDDKDAFARDDETAARVVEVAVHGFATKRGDRYLTLSPSTGAYWNTAMVLSSDLQAAQALGNCLRTVIDDRHLAKKDYTTATTAKPTS